LEGDFRGSDEYGELPAHAGAVFTGDHLFVSGIGQLWEGDELQFLIGADKLRQLPGLTAVFVGHEYTETLAPWAAWLEPDNEVVNDKLDWVLRQRYGTYDPMPTIPSTIELEIRTNPYLRCNEHKMMSRLGVPPEKEPEDPEDTLTRLKKEAVVLGKLLKLKRDTLSYSMLPMGLPRSYRDGAEIAKTRLPIFFTAVRRLQKIVLLSGPLEAWRDRVGITPRDFHEEEQVVVVSTLQEDAALQEAILRSMESSVGEGGGATIGGREGEIPVLLRKESLIPAPGDDAVGADEIAIAMEEEPVHSSQV